MSLDCRGNTAHPRLVSLQGTGEGKLLSLISEVFRITCFCSGMPRDRLFAWAVS